MARKIDYTSLVGKTFKPKSEHEYEVIQYLFKEKTNHFYTIKFLETGNFQNVTYNQIKNETVIDLVQRKKLKTLETTRKLKERTKLTKDTSFDFDYSKIKDKRLLAVDLSTTATGVCYASGNEIKRSKVIVPGKSDNHIKRSYEIIEELEQIIIKGKIEYVFLEGIYLGLNSDVLVKLSEIRGMLRGICLKNKVKMVIVPAILWKNHFSFMPVYRNDQKIFTMKFFEEINNKKPETDDEADAFAIMQFFLDKMNNIEKNDTRVSM